MLKRPAAFDGLVDQPGPGCAASWLRPPAAPPGTAASTGKCPVGRSAAGIAHLVSGELRRNPTRPRRSCDFLVCDALAIPADSAFWLRRPSLARGIMSTNGSRHPFGCRYCRRCPRGKPRLRLSSCQPAWLTPRRNGIVVADMAEPLEPGRRCRRLHDSLTVASPPRWSSPSASAPSPYREAVQLHAAIRRWFDAQQARVAERF